MVDDEPILTDENTAAHDRLEAEASKSFSAPADYAASVTHQAFPVIVADPPPAIELRDYQKAAVAAIKEGLPQVSPIRSGYGMHRPHQVLAIAAAVIASSPGMFDGPDVLEALPRARREPEEDLRPPGGYRIKTEVSFAQPEAHHIRPPKSRALYLQRAGRDGKPAGSKLARKAAKGKL